MTIAIIAVLLALLLGSAAIIIPRLVNRGNDPDDHADSRAYLEETGRTAGDIAQGNHGQTSWQENHAGAPRTGDIGTDKTS